MPPSLAGVVAISAGLFSSAPPPVASYTISEPIAVLEFDAPTVKGTPAQLSWSDEGSEWYLQTLEGTQQHHYLIHLENPRPEEVDAEPEWGWAYWTWKSMRTAPHDSSILIAADVDRRAGQVPTETSRQRANSTWDGETLISGAMSASTEANWSTTITLRLNNEIVGRFKDRVVPGRTFSWSPWAAHGFAYVTTSGHLAVLDLEGGKQDVPHTTDVLLPAWSPDGSAIAFLRRSGKKRYVIERVSIAVR